MGTGMPIHVNPSVPPSVLSHQQPRVSVRLWIVPRTTRLGASYDSVDVVLDELLIGTKYTSGDLDVRYFHCDRGGTGRRTSSQSPVIGLIFGQPCGLHERERARIGVRGAPFLAKRLDVDELAVCPRAAPVCCESAAPVAPEGLVEAGLGRA